MIKEPCCTRINRRQKQFFAKSTSSNLQFGKNLMPPGFVVLVTDCPDIRRFKLGHSHCSSESVYQGEYCGHHLRQLVTVSIKLGQRFQQNWLRCFRSDLDSEAVPFPYEAFCAALRFLRTV